MELIATEAREIDKNLITDPEILVVNGRRVRGGSAIAHKMSAGEFYITSLPDSGDRIVICCPFCESTILTDYEHLIINKSPLTVQNIIACPYSIHIEDKEIAIQPPTPFLRRMVWEVFGKKTATIQEEKYHAFQIKEGKITPA